MQKIVILACSLLLTVRIAAAQPATESATPGSSGHEHHAHHHAQHDHQGMQMDVDGMVMNENYDQLPRDCEKIAGEQAITVHAGTTYAQRFSGTIFGYDQHEWNVAPCTKLTVTFVNEDTVRHQWMLHGLPRYLHPEGMLHIEINGRGSKSGTFITPGAKKTYLVHCDIAQHMEKGMKAQLKVGGGNGDLPSIPGVTAARYPETYSGAQAYWGMLAMLLACVLGIVVTVRGVRWWV
jgi:plastocyanin